MGNLLDSIDAQPAEEPSIDSDSSTESLEFNADEIIIDLDAPEYKEYLKHKRKLSRSEGNLKDISYLQWMKENNIRRGSQINLSESTKENNRHVKTSRRCSAPVIGNEIFVIKKNSEECEKRCLGSKQRIQDIKEKYHLKDRDYSARRYVWHEEDEKKVKREREERRRLRQEIRNKYNFPTPSQRRITKAATG